MQRYQKPRLLRTVGVGGDIWTAMFPPEITTPATGMSMNHAYRDRQRVRGTTWGVAWRFLTNRSTRAVVRMLSNSADTWRKVISLGFVRGRVRSVRQWGSLDGPTCEIDLNDRDGLGIGGTWSSCELYAQPFESVEKPEQRASTVGCNHQRLRGDGQQKHSEGKEIWTKPVEGRLPPDCGSSRSVSGSNRVTLLTCDPCRQRGRREDSRCRKTVQRSKRSSQDRAEAEAKPDTRWCDPPPIYSFLPTLRSLCSILSDPSDPSGCLPRGSQHSTDLYIRRRW